jgi:hypothetical protein
MVDGMNVHFGIGNDDGLAFYQVIGGQLFIQGPSRKVGFTPTITGIFLVMSSNTSTGSRLDVIALVTLINSSR